MTEPRDYLPPDEAEVNIILAHDAALVSQPARFAAALRDARAENAALRAQVNALLSVARRFALGAIGDEIQTRAYWEQLKDDAESLLASTPEQSLAEHDREVVERCADAAAKSLKGHDLKKRVRDAIRALAEGKEGE